MRRTERSVEGCNVMNELWKDIPGYEGKYQASTEGRIRSLSRPLRGRNKYGEFTRMMAGRVLRPSGQAKDPHLYVRLGHGANGSPVHQLVARTFLGPRPPGEDIRHLNGDPLDNRVENLCYGTRSDNLLDVFRQGWIWRKLSLKQIGEIKQRLRAGETGEELAREYGVSGTSISRIKRGIYKSCDILE